MQVYSGQMFLNNYPGRGLSVKPVRIMYVSYNIIGIVPVRGIYEPQAVPPQHPASVVLRPR